MSVKRGPLEVFKFALYLAVPVSLTGWVVYQRETFQNIIDYKKYVNYPSEESSHSFEDVEASLKERLQKTKSSSS